MSTQRALRTVVVTGANRGLGYGLVEAFAKAHLAQQDPRGPGWQIVFTARDEGKCGKTLEKLRKTYSDVSMHTHPLELADPKSVDRFVAFLRDKYAARVDVLVNNAGMFLRRHNFPEEVRNTLNTNLHGVIDLTEKLLPLLSEDGKVVAVSSQLGALKLQGEHVRSLVGRKRDDIDIPFIKAIADEYYETSAKSEASEEWKKVMANKWNNVEPYWISKCLLNAYVRSILPRKLVRSQMCYTMTPGQVRTDMGAPTATRTVEQGVDTMFYLAAEIPFTKNEELNGQFFMDRKFLEF